MAELWEAPAKLNFSLLVGRVETSGYHPVSSVVQTIDWYDLLTFVEAGEDSLEIDGAELPEGTDNLVWKAVSALRARVERPGPQLGIRLEKRLPVAAGLGGGSSDAAAALLAACSVAGWPSALAEEVAPQVGADVPYLLSGGPARIEGYGERIIPLRRVDGYTVGVFVPPTKLATRSVYRRWDEMGGPTGKALPLKSIPPPLREHGPFRNDLQPAAAGLYPELSDWIGDLSGLWGRPVTMTGSGPALFAFFEDRDEAEEAVASAPTDGRSVAALPRPQGAAPAEGSWRTLGSA